MASVRCIAKDGKLSSRKSDFVIKLDMFIEARQATLLPLHELLIVCKVDNWFTCNVNYTNQAYHRCSPGCRVVSASFIGNVFTVESTTFKSHFMSQINNSFGSGDMSLALNEAQFAQFIQFLKDRAIMGYSNDYQCPYIYKMSTTATTLPQATPLGSGGHLW